MTFFLILLALLSLAAIVVALRDLVADGYRRVPTRPDLVARRR